MNKGFRIIYPGGEVEFPCEENALTNNVSLRKGSV